MVSQPTGGCFYSFAHSLFNTMKTPLLFSAALVVALVCTFTHTQAQTTATTTAISTTATQSLTLFPREAYMPIPVNIGFVAPLSVGNIVQAATGKRIVSNVSLHLIGGVGNALEGVEGSGIFNVQTDYVNGVQGAGVINIVGGDAAWAQGAGIANIVNGRFDGAQGAGVFNIAAKGLSGAQGAGIMNIASGKVEGAQGAGVVNVAGDLHGVQGAGVLNIAENVHGVQGAGVSNHAKNVAGLQIAGILNTAVTVTGAQIGLINIAENNEGVMLGLLSFSAAQGLHVDLWTDETRFIRFGLRTGNKNFYNLWSFGLQPFNGITLWSIGYGIGTQIYMSKNDYIDISILGESTFEGTGTRFWNYSTSLAHFRFLYGHEFSKHFAVFIGPTLNFSWSQYGNNLPEIFPASWTITSAPYPINSRAWIGISGGFRF